MDCQQLSVPDMQGNEHYVLTTHPNTTCRIHVGLDKLQAVSPNNSIEIQICKKAINGLSAAVNLFASVEIIKQNYLKKEIFNF